MFVTDNFLLKNEAGRRLYHEYAEKMPIIDYHCHIDVREIAEDIRYDNITQAWIALDHYKWTAMRANGVPEKYITAEGADKEKFFAWAKTLPRCIGSPLYHRSHIELKNTFGFKKTLSLETAKEAWEHCNKRLQDLSARKLIERANVQAIGTTDDILDDMSSHDKIAADPTFAVKVVPTFRTDPVMNIDLPGFAEYIGKLSGAAGCSIRNFTDLIKAIGIRMDFFAQRGCKSIDQALTHVPCYKFDREEIDLIFQKALAGGKSDKREGAIYQNALLNEIAAACHSRGWVMQLHVGVKRDINTWLLQNVGVDVGGDCIGNYNNMSMLPHFMNELNERGCLPKMIVYSINPADNPVLDSMIGCFQNSEAVGKIQHGAAWWFNDTMYGIKNYINSLANLSLISNAVGWLTDSRAFLTYSRHEYFRRILCNIVGGWIEDGEYPGDLELVGGMIEDICFHNANRYFGFDL
jgi:glucuronate isomerase